MVELMDKKYPKKEMLASEKNLAKNGAKLIEKEKIPLRDLLHSNGHSFEAAPLRDSCQTAQRHIWDPPSVYHI